MLLTGEAAVTYLISHVNNELRTGFLRADERQDDEEHIDTPTERTVAHFRG